MGLRTVYSPDAQKKTPIQRLFKMKAALSLKRLDSLILNEKPEDLTRKDEMDWITKNSDAIAYIKLSLADEQAFTVRGGRQRESAVMKLERLTSAKAKTEKLTRAMN
ncbi:hypothetical protein TNCV_1265081 [Trichonephila clavipes]|nr:hypothetical protein TNCV_1265081 [Trichonephila clavipes]